MGKVRFSITMSLDGYIAGPSPSLEEPLGEGGEQLHEWVFALEAWRTPHGLEGGEVNESTPVIEGTQENVGAYLMGRNMFGGGPGPGVTTPGTAGGATTRRSTRPYSSSPTTHASRSRCRRDDVLVRHGRGRGGARAGRVAAGDGGRPDLRRRERRAAGLDAGPSTSSRSRSRRCCWAAGRGSSGGLRGGSSSSIEAIYAPGVAHLQLPRRPLSGLGRRLHCRSARMWRNW